MKLRRFIAAVTASLALALPFAANGQGTTPATTVSPNAAKFQVYSFKYYPDPRLGGALSRTLVGANIEWWQVRWVLDVWIKNPATGGYGWRTLHDETSRVIHNPLAEKGIVHTVLGKPFVFPAAKTRANYHYRFTAYLEVKAWNGRPVDGIQVRQLTRKFRPIA